MAPPFRFATSGHKLSLASVHATLTVLLVLCTIYSTTVLVRTQDRTYQRVLELCVFLSGTFDRNTVILYLIHCGCEVEPSPDAKHSDTLTYD